uniref:HTH CENPB-type domain-containing protein n=1 Tax=Pelusios castaneus TaxID=367368 RepID=A0A8C8SN22_9SAUR
MSKTKRLAYKIPFKLEVVKYAKEHGNRAAERHFGPPPTEKMIREWRKQEDQLQKLDKTKHTFRGHAAKWPQLEMDMKEWITLHRNMGFSVSTKMIIYEAKRIAVEKGIKDFTGSPSWCYRFMRRSGLAMSSCVLPSTPCLLCDPTCSITASSYNAGCLFCTALCSNLPVSGYQG